MSELLAFAAPMLVLAAMTCGWAADTLSPARGYGLLIDMGLGLVGAVVLAAVLHGANVLGPVGLVVTFVIGAVGGSGAIVGQRRFWRSATL